MAQRREERAHGIQLLRGQRTGAPCTHLISLNQSSAERKENVMRLHVAKSRFFKKGDTIKIATDYDNEVFFDAQRTLNLNRD